MMASVVLLLTLAVAHLSAANSGACGRPKYVYPTSRIVGGTVAGYGQYPWQISLRQKKGWIPIHKCGATLLNPNWAITAAHCVDKLRPQDLFLVMGVFNLIAEKEVYPHMDRHVQLIVPHPKFDTNTFEYDLALLRFHPPVRYQPNVIPICLPDADSNFLGRVGHVSGWGRIYDGGPLSSRMQHVGVPIINNTECELMFRQVGYEEIIPSIFSCAGYAEGKRDACEGDSGGPLVVQQKDHWVLAGIASWGIGCGESNKPGVYVRVSKFIDWIKRLIVL